MALDVRSLRTLQTVLQSGSFAAAGRALGYTPSAVSQQMSALERSLNIRLFERGAKQIVATEAAQYLMHRAEELFELLHQIDIDVGRLGAGQVGRLRVGTFNSAGGAVLGRALSRFLVRRRDVEITLDEGEPDELFPRVADGSLDVALGFEYDLVPSRFPDSLRLEPVMTEDLLIVAPPTHRLSRKPAVQLRELRDEKWVAHRRETPSHECLLNLCAGTDASGAVSTRDTAGAAAASAGVTRAVRGVASGGGFAPDIAFRSNHLGTVLGIVEAGLAIAMVPRIALYERPGRVAELAVVEPLPRRHIVAAVRDSDVQPLIEAFVQALRQAIAP